LGNDNLEILLLYVFVRSFGQGIQTSAFSAFISQIVPREYLIGAAGFQRYFLHKIIFDVC